MRVTELFKSIQGESTYAGQVCSFIRLTGCNIRCTWCDSEYTFQGGTDMSIDEILIKMKEFNSPLVEVTGGEPMMHKETPYLCERLIDEGHTVLIETNGCYDISLLPKEVIKIMDVKCPDSNESHTFLKKNLTHITKDDQCKFVAASEEDVLWSIDFVKKHGLTKKCTVLFSPVASQLSEKKLAEYVINSNLDIRLNLQLHKIIWGTEATGV